MVGIYGIGNVPELANTKPDAPKDKKTSDVTTTAPSDGVQISSEAQRATEVAKLVSLTQGQQDLRQKEIDAAQQQIEQGTYKTVNQILQVAVRVGKMLG